MACGPLPSGTGPAPGRRTPCSSRPVPSTKRTACSGSWWWPRPPGVLVRDRAMSWGVRGGPTVRALPARDRPDDEKRLRPRRHRGGQRRVLRLVRQILRAGEESQERPALRGDVVADRPAQHRITGLERVEHRRPREGPPPRDLQRDLVVDPRQRPQVRRQHHADHGSACTSTDSTAGRSRTMGDQLSPPSADAYTWPPVVPKYTPHGSSVSTHIASRSTFT